MTELILWTDDGGVMFAQVEGDAPAVYVLPATDTALNRHGRLTFEHSHTYDVYHHYRLVGVEYDQEAA